MTRALMIKIARRGATGISALMCLVVLAGWMLSTFYYFSFPLSPNSGWGGRCWLSIDFHPGAISLRLFEGLEQHVWLRPHASIDRISNPSFQQPLLGPGFQFERRMLFTSVDETTMSGILLPSWFAFLVTAIAPSLAMYHWKHAPVPGHCTHCGYDLRATPGRCPECGMTAPASMDVPQIAIQGNHGR